MERGIFNIRVSFLISEDKVRDLCIRKGLYTRGDCQAYSRLLNGLCGLVGYEEFEFRLNDIVSDILDHSDESFNNYEFGEILARKIVGNCVSTFVKGKEYLYTCFSIAETPEF